LIKNSQPFGKKFQKTVGVDFFWLTLYTMHRKRGPGRDRWLQDDHLKHEKNSQMQKKLTYWHRLKHMQSTQYT